MGKNKLWVGIVLGALAGGLLALTDREAREYARQASIKAKVSATYYLENPSVAVENVKGIVGMLNDKLN